MSQRKSRWYAQITVYNSHLQSTVLYLFSSFSPHNVTLKKCTWIVICERSYAGAALCGAFCNTSQAKSLTRQSALLLSWGAMAHIRRIFAKFNERQVLDALRLAGMEMEIDPRGLKAMQPEQSHERWQVNWIGVKCIYATVSVASASNPILSLFKEGKAGLRKLDLCAHDS